MKKGKRSDLTSVRWVGTLLSRAKKKMGTQGYSTYWLLGCKARCRFHLRFADG